MATFDEAAKRFEVERQNANDFLAGDRLRALQKLDAEAEQLRAEARAILERGLDQALAAGKNSDDARKLLTATVVTFFDDALRKVIRKVGARIEEVFARSSTSR